MREQIQLNQNWCFVQKDVGRPETLPLDWEKVDLPHLECGGWTGWKRKL